ncbi:MAG: hypothetical protein IIB15_06490, partial [Chloroflexi bacterium]|nr:hypothetical protein [Chloroflexota bacterium]
MATSKTVRPSLSYALYPMQAVLRRTAQALPEKLAVIDGEHSYPYR